MNFKFQISNVKFPMCLLGIGYLTLVLFDIPGLAQAASPSPSPNKSLTEFQKKVEDIKKEAASKAAQLKTEVSQTIQNKAFIGQVTQINDRQIILQSAKGTKTINTDEYTTFQDISKKSMNIRDLKSGDFISCLGDVDDKGTLKAKRVIRSKAPIANEKAVVWGQIQSIVVGNLTVLKNDNQKVTVRTDASTAFKLGNNEAQTSDLKINNFIISIGSKLNNNSTNSQFIYILNPKGDLKVASSSASPSASPKK